MAAAKEDRLVWEAALPIQERQWLPMAVNGGSLASIMRKLELEPLNISDNPNAFDVVDKRHVFLCSNKRKKKDAFSRVVGFVCVASAPFEFDELKPLVQRRPLIPLVIENSNPTIGLLNIFAMHSKDSRSFGPLLDEYFGDRTGENYSVLHATEKITPIPFVHNWTARHFPQAVGGEQHVHAFVQQKDSTLLIGKDGNLQQFANSALDGREFFEFARKKWNCRVFVVVDDPLAETNHSLAEKRAELAALLPEGRENNSYLDQTLDDEQLHELSQLADEIESAEDFELVVDNGGQAVEEEAKVDDDQVRQLERQIRELIKEQGRIKEIFCYLNWEQAKSGKNLLRSRDYFDFFHFYKRKVDVDTPKAMRKRGMPTTPTPPRRTTPLRAVGNKKRKAEASEAEGTTKRRSLRLAN